VTNAIGAAVGGRSFGIVARSDGALLSWGDNTGDQLGNTTLSSTGVSTPTVVPGFSAGP
jgi:alpha-tubulin suppressor-like RCC1 family protein